MIAALDNIFGGNPTLNPYDGNGAYNAFIDAGGNGGYLGGGGGGSSNASKMEITFVIRR